MTRITHQWLRARVNTNRPSDLPFDPVEAYNVNGKVSMSMAKIGRQWLRATVNSEERVTMAKSACQ